MRLCRVPFKDFPPPFAIYVIQFVITDANAMKTSWITVPTILIYVEIMGKQDGNVQD